MRNMSVSCDCEGAEAEPVVTPDVGIVASLDILAADNACIDVLYSLPEGGGSRGGLGGAGHRPCHAEGKSEVKETETW